MIQELNNDKIRELKNLSKKYDLLLLILFGSRAKGNYRKDSDWDFAFYPPNNFSIQDEMNLFDDLMNIVKNEKIDLINLNLTKKLYVANNIFNTGMLIYEKSKNLFNQKRWGFWFELQDFERYHKWQVELTKSHLREMM